MTVDILLALMAYAFVTSITPGPNNAMLLVSSVNFGFRPTVPHIFGITSGFSVMVLAIGLGIGSLFVVFPFLHDVLRYGGALYLLYLAWQIAHSSSLGEAKTTHKPFTFLQAAAFQVVNPKAWVMAVGAVAAYTPANGYFFNILIVILVFALINLACISAWAGFGAALRKYLSQTVYLRIFNITMAVLLALSLYPLFSE